jgi:integrase
MSISRRKGGGRVPLPPNVFPVYGKRGQTYFYWQRGRNLPKEQRSKLVRLRGDRTHMADVFQHAAELNGLISAEPRAGTFTAALTAYRASQKWQRLAAATRLAYGRYLDMAAQAWGRQMVADLSLEGVRRLRDETARSIPPNTANQAMHALCAFLKWCCQRGLAATNIAKGLEALEHDVDTTAPWPDEAWEAVARTPGPLGRLAVLGRATGQRIGDLVKMRPVDRHADGIRLTITKTRKPHFLALSQRDMAVIDGWGVPKMQPYISGPGGARLSPGQVRHMLRERLADVSPHGLRALAICDARLRGLEHQQIASLFGMSIAMVERYSRHIDQEIAGRKARARMDETGTRVENLRPKSAKRPL